MVRPGGIVPLPGEYPTTADVLGEGVKHDGVLYPRSGTLGGCTAHNAMITVYPHDADWDGIARATGDRSWRSTEMRRWFEPIRDEVAGSAAWSRLLLGLTSQVARLRSERPWYVEAHQFRIDTRDGIGRPTPEGAHRDGVDFVAVLIVDRSGIRGGETRVFDANGPDGQRFTLAQPWSLLLLDDARVIHESTPIQPDGEGGGHRDTLVLTWRADGFQGDD